MIVSNFPGGSDIFALPLDGSKEMTGALKLGGNQIKNIGAPEEETDAARKQEVTDHNKSDDAHANILRDMVKANGGATMTMGETIGVGPYDIQITEDGDGGDVTAKDVSYDNSSSGMSATNVQDAIGELMAGKAASLHKHNADDISEPIPISKGGTGVGSMAGSDYATYRPRGIMLSATEPDTIPNGCIVGVYE